MTCSRQVFPQAVIDAIARQMEGYGEDTTVEIPERMRVQECLRKADLSEALVCCCCHCKSDPVFARMMDEHATCSSHAPPSSLLFLDD